LQFLIASLQTNQQILEDLHKPKDDRFHNLKYFVSKSPNEGNLMSTFFLEIIEGGALLLRCVCASFISIFQKMSKSRVSNKLDDFFSPKEIEYLKRVKLLLDRVSNLFMNLAPGINCDWIIVLKQKSQSGGYLLKSNQENSSKGSDTSGVSWNLVSEDLTVGLALLEKAVKNSFDLHIS
jgi:hypothetical protein